MARSPRLLLAAALLVVAAACGDAADDGGETAEAPADSDEAPADPVADAAPQGVEASGLVMASTDLGDILTTSEARSVYLFEADQQGESTCFDTCAASWPPVLLSGDAPEAGDGVDADLLGTSERPDGGVQLTYDGWPLYLWAGDQAAGDVAGQGVNDVWWVIDADGTPIHEDLDASEGADPAPDDQDEDDGYGY